MVGIDYDIIVGKYRVKHLLEVEVRKSANKLVDTATIRLSGMSQGSALDVESKIKRGNDVTIKAGYAERGELPTEFTGYVSSIKTDNTIEILCEDGMYQFRRDIQSKQYKDVTVGDLVQEIVDQIDGFSLVVHPGTEVLRYDKFTIDNATGYEVLRKISKENKIHIFIKGNVLHVALKYTYKEGDVHYDFSKSIEKSSLRYVQEKDKKVLVEVVGIKRDHTKTTVVVGDRGGDKITVHRYNVSDKKALEVTGLEELNTYRFTGYEGDMTTWLYPYVTYGYTAHPQDTAYPQREGGYYVEAVTTKITGNSGGQRKLTLGIKT